MLRGCQNGGQTVVSLLPAFAFALALALANANATIPTPTPYAMVQTLLP